MSKMYVNLKNIEYNVNEIRKKLSKDTNIIAMIKANAYGLGDVEVCKFLENIGINIFGIALVKEGRHLRENGINSKLLVTGQYTKEDIEDIVKYDLTVSLSNLEYITKLNNLAKKNNKIITIHLKIDTGMSRLGFKIDDLKENVLNILKLPNICIEGIYTHLSSADSDKDYTLNQISIFEKAITILKELNVNLKYIHCLNSAGTLNYIQYAFNTIRIGDILYGYYPDNSLRDKISLKPAVKLATKITHISNYSKGTKISYNQKYELEKDSKIAVVSMGYADGLFRCLSNKYEVVINNAKCKILGNICMDMFMCDISNAGDVKIGDEVTIIDYDDSIYEMANMAETITYEIISRISPRVDRIYVKK